MDGNGLTIDVVLAGYLRTKDAAEVLAKRHSEEMAPLQTTMENCKSWLLNYLNEQGLDNAKTESGLAYKSTIMSATVDPEGGWQLLLGHILEAAIGRGLDVIESGGAHEEAMEAILQTPALSLLNHAVNKSAVKEAMEQGVAVPGVKVSHIIQVNVRRS